MDEKEIKRDKMRCKRSADEGSKEKDPEDGRV